MRLYSDDQLEQARKACSAFRLAARTHAPNHAGALEHFPAARKLCEAVDAVIEGRPWVTDYDFARDQVKFVFSPGADVVMETECPE